MTSLEVYDSAARFAWDHMDATANDSIRFGEWFMRTYPEGDKSVRDAYAYWDAEVR